MDIGEKIKTRRIALGLTLEDVGDAVGVGKSTVRKWELGMIKNMRRDKIEKLARVLGMDPVDFIIQIPEDPQPEEHYIAPQKLTDREHRILDAFRHADTRSQDDALQMLLAHRKD